MSPLRTLASTSSSPWSDRIGLFAAKTRGVADVRHRNNDVLRGRPRKCGTRGCSTGDSGREHSVEYPALSFRALAREQLPRLLSLARRLVGEDAEDRLFPGRQTTSPIGRRCFGRIGVPASPTRSVWAGLGLALRALEEWDGSVPHDDANPPDHYEWDQDARCRSPSW